MRFNHLIHPEVVLNLRGNSDIREYYHSVLKDISPRGANPLAYDVFDEHGVRKSTLLDNIPAYTFSQELIASVSGDVNMLDHWAMCKMFMVERPPIFHLSKEFAQALSEIDKEIPLDILPDRYFCYLSFPEKTLFDDTCWVQGAYVYVGKGADCNLNNEFANEKILWISYVGYPARGAISYDITRLAVDLRPETVSKLISTVETIDKPEMIMSRESLDPKKRNHVFKSIINSLVYIHSQDPAIEYLRPTRNLSSATKKTLIKSGGHLNDCSLPIAFLNWSYQKPKHWNINQTTVKAHMRWQRCGSQLSQVKLILIDEHIRNYEHTDKTTTAQDVKNPRPSLSV